MSFKDHFSGHASAYAQFRPHYPESLFQYLATIAPARERAWDCATGNGQAAIGLTEYFHEVIATDASEQQIRNAETRPNISYRVAPAEASGLADSSIDLVTVAQALHWFDFPAFFSETNRVLRPGGIIAVWAYTLLKIAPQIDALVDRFYYVTTEPYWPPEWKIVEGRYRGIAFPFHELTPPSFQLQENWSLDQLLGYLRTWSATRRFISERGCDPVSGLEYEVLPKWGERKLARLVHWPLHLRIGIHALTPNLSS
jgi:SAM-dependent methyltransferase